MGRGKIEIKRIESTSNRNVTFTKRKNGIIKKASEISVLCEAQVSVIIFGSKDQMIEHFTEPFSNILETYQTQSRTRLWDTKHENLSNEIDRIKKENDNLQIELRHMRGDDVCSLSIEKLIEMEDILEMGLTSVRSKMMEIYKMKKRNTRMLEQETSELSHSVHQQEIDMGVGVKAKEMEDDGYSQRIKLGYDSQMPFSFRVQPIQPNLQDRMS